MKAEDSSLHYYDRKVAPKIREALEDTRVVLISGPRQAGKTTLARQFVADNRPYFTLDDIGTLAAARNDPVGFIRGLDGAVIDEIQRAPELMLALKESVDIDTRPGRFLITGSANLATVPAIADSLAGRMAVISLFPLAQAEIIRAPGEFLHRVFSDEPFTSAGSPVNAGDLIELSSRGISRSLAKKECQSKTSVARRLYLRDSGS